VFRIYVGIFEFLSLKSREYQKVKNLGFWKFDGKIQRRSSKKKPKKVFGILKCYILKK